MQNEVTILIAEEDSGHAALIERNLRRAGVDNTIMRLADGIQILDYLRAVEAPAEGLAFLARLDTRMPKVDGIGVLREIESDRWLMAIEVPRIRRSLKLAG